MAPVSVPINANAPIVTRPDPKRRRAARRYASDRVHASVWPGLCLGMLVGFLLLPAGTSAIRDMAASISGNPWVIVGVYVLVVTSLVLAVSLPGAYVLGYALPRKYGLIRLGRREWWVGYVATVGKVLGWSLVVGELFYWVVRTTPDWWWVVTAILCSATILSLSYGWPPDRFRSRRLRALEDPELARTLAQLIEQTDAPQVSMWMLPADKKRWVVDAWQAGLGRMRRIVISERMLRTFNYDEIETILAHELAHARNGDVARALSLRIAAIVIASYLAYLVAGILTGPAFAGPADIAMLPYILICYGATWSLTSVVIGYFWRRAEVVADRYATDVTGMPEAFRSALIKLADLNLMELQPTARTREFAPTHPTVGSRIATVQVAAGERTSGAPHRRRKVRRIKVREFVHKAQRVKEEQGAQLAFAWSRARGGAANDARRLMNSKK
jgi:STE24 endopeptidase